MNPKADKYSSMTRDERFIESWSFIWFRAWDKKFFKIFKKFIKKTESSGCRCQISFVFFENTFHLKQNHWEKPLSVLWYEIIQDVKKKSKKIIKQPQKQNRMILFW